MLSFLFTASKPCLQSPCVCPIEDSCLASSLGFAHCRKGSALLKAMTMSKDCKWKPQPQESLSPRLQIRASLKNHSVPEFPTKSAEASAINVWQFSLFLFSVLCDILPHKCCCQDNTPENCPLKLPCESLFPRNLTYDLWGLGSETVLENRCSRMIWEQYSKSTGCEQVLIWWWWMVYWQSLPCSSLTTDEIFSGIKLRSGTHRQW